MNLHEYQAKKLFAKYGLPVPNSRIIHSIDEALTYFDELQTNRYVVKAQVHAGGRGKAGGIKIIKSKDEIKEAIQSMLNKRLVTYQTDSNGQPVNEILIEEVCEIAREIYIGVLVDRSSGHVCLIASTEGGIELETFASKHPEKILKIFIDPLLGVMPYQCRELGFNLGLEKKQIKLFTTLLTSLGLLFIQEDLTLLEINPLVITNAGELVCLDGKINIDDNALYRHPQLSAMRDPTQEDKRELQAKEWELNYISLDGNIGCMVNGAGLAMATMDLIKISGGNPANFLDIGGSATKERVCEAFKIILSDEKVKVILVNIFGGIMRCDLIAKGIIAAIKNGRITLPIVIRLEGNCADEAKLLLNESKMKIIAAKSFDDAAKQAVAATGII